MYRCASVTIGRPQAGTYTVERPQKADVTIGCAQTGWFTAEAQPLTADIECVCQNHIDVTVALICGTGIGAAILCGSDGALITLDGKYLIVEQ